MNATVCLGLKGICQMRLVSTQMSVQLEQTIVLMYLMGDRYVMPDYFFTLNS